MLASISHKRFYLNTKTHRRFYLNTNVLATAARATLLNAWLISKGRSRITPTLPVYAWWRDNRVAKHKARWLKAFKKFHRSYLIANFSPGRTRRLSIKQLSYSLQYRLRMSSSLLRFLL